MSVSTHIYSYPEVGVALKLDIYFAPPSQVARNPVPGIVYFHGGSLISGNRDFLCKDIKRDTLSRGWAFVSADYRLLIPSTGHEILRDVKALFAFLGDPEGGLNKELKALSCPHQIDPNRLFVGGSSAGAYPAFLAALFAQPRPRGFYSLYGMGGDLLSEDYLPKLREKVQDGELDEEDRVWTVEEVLDHASDLRKFFDPTPEEAKVMRSVADVPSSLAPRVIPGGFRSPGSSASSISSRSSSATRSPGPQLPSVVTTDLIPGTNIPGHRARLNGTLRAAMRKTGTFLDFLTGQQISTPLSELEKYEDRCAWVAKNEKIKYLIPQIWIDKDFPPSIVIHGDEDHVVRIGESQKFVDRLRSCGVDCLFLVAEGKGHSFEERASPEVYVKYVKPVVEFLRRLP